MICFKIQPKGKTNEGSGVDCTMLMPMFIRLDVVFFLLLRRLERCEMRRLGVAREHAVLFPLCRR